jgi:hypothetical protein
MCSLLNQLSLFISCLSALPSLRMTSSQNSIEAGQRSSGAGTPAEGCRREGGTANKSKLFWRLNESNLQIPLYKWL